jgi:hypothetical protein
VVARQPCCHVQLALKLGQWLCVPRFHVVCPYQAMAPRGRWVWERARGVPGIGYLSWRRQKWALGSQSAARGGVGLTYLAEKTGAVSPSLLPWSPRPPTTG